MLKFSFDSKNFEKKVKEIEKNADAISREVVEQVGSIVKTNARHYVPVDTGALKASINMEVKNNVAEIGSPLEYAPHVEYGTVSQKPYPYLTPAKNEAEAKAGSITRKVVSKYVND